VDLIGSAAGSAAAGTHALADLMRPVRLVAESSAATARDMTGQVEQVAEAMAQAREAVMTLNGTAERLQTLIAHFQLTDAARQAVDLPVSVRCATGWSGQRHARIVDLSATGARIEALDAPAGGLVHLSFRASPTRPTTVRAAKVVRAGVADGVPWVGLAFVDAPRERAA
jgi:hypothetical protein